MAHTAVHAADIKISTWNLNWLTTTPAHYADLPQDVHPRAPADIARLAAFATKLDADIVAFEEVDGAATAARLFAPTAYTLLTIHQDVLQQVGLAVRRPIIAHQNDDLAALDVEPPAAPHRLRHGLDASLTFPNGATLRVLALHLKTGCLTDNLGTSTRRDCALFARQVPLVAAWVHARAAQGIPFVVLGDFNRDFDTPETLLAALANAAPLLRVTAGQSDPCWGQSPFIDHIFLGGAARDWLVPGSLRVLTYHSTDTDDEHRLSDHCPVSVRLSIVR